MAGRSVRYSPESVLGFLESEGLTPSAVARILRISPQAVDQWRRNGAPFSQVLALVALRELSKRDGGSHEDALAMLLAQMNAAGMQLKTWNNSK